MEINTIEEDDGDGTSWKVQMETEEEENKTGEEDLRQATVEGNWNKVITMYKEHGEFHKITIDESKGTALHVAVNVGLEHIVGALVDAIIKHEKKEGEKEKVDENKPKKEGKKSKKVKALELKNDLGNTPLHLASSRDFISICKCIIGSQKERSDLVVIRNDKGETPLFVAANSWQRHAFVYLFDVYNWRVQRITAQMTEVPGIRIKLANRFYLADLIRDNGDSMLHGAIRKEFFDLALIIMDKYSILAETQNDDGITPLKVLATRSSAFPSGIKLPWWKNMIYHWLDAVWNIKHKHKWCHQLLKKFMDKPYGSYRGGAGRRPSLDKDESGEEDEDSATSIYSVIEKKREEDKQKEIKIEEEKPNKTDTKETPLLTAARHGIVEMVDALLYKIPSAIYETDSDRNNVLLVAVKNRQSYVVEALRKRIGKMGISWPGKAVWQNLLRGVDSEGNTVLHLAAKAPRIDKIWKMPGSAMQMMWDIKWFKYIESIVPHHYVFRTNESEETAEEIFHQSHTELVNKSSGWLKETSESCSLVAALVAGVSFATCSTVPGGSNEDTGKPALEGQPAFDAFAISSLVGLFFSVTALIMFLSILTSRKEVKDFRTELPLKLFLGLSSLFISIAAMFVSFYAGDFFLLKHKHKQILFPVYVATCLPVTFYAIAQFALYADLLRAIFRKVPRPRARWGYL